MKLNAYHITAQVGRADDKRELGEQVSNALLAANIDVANVINIETVSAHEEHWVWTYRIRVWVREA